MWLKIIAIAALSGVAFGQTFTNPTLPSCATPCLQQMQSVLGCDPTLLTCSCAQLTTLTGNVQFDECLESKCGPTVTDNVAEDLGENCGHYDITASTVPGSMPSTSAPVMNTNPAATSITSAPAGAASPTKSANVAAQSDAGMAAMGLAIAAAFVL